MTVEDLIQFLQHDDVPKDAPVFLALDGEFKVAIAVEVGALCGSPVVVVSDNTAEAIH